MIARVEGEAREVAARLREIEARPLTGPGVAARAPSLEEVCFPGGKAIGIMFNRARRNVSTVSKDVFQRMLVDLTRNSKMTATPPDYGGQWYRLPNSEVAGVRISNRSGPTIDVIQTLSSLVPPRFKVHSK